MCRPRPPVLLAAGLGLTVSLLAGCGGEPPTGPGGGGGGGNGGDVASVVVTPASDTLEAVGATVQLQAEARDAGGDPVAGASFTWSSSDASVATVDDEGVVEAVADGDAEITAAASGESGSAALAVVQAVDDVSVTPASATLTAVGDTVRFTATAADAEGAAVPGVDVAWSSADTTVATVDDEGLAVAVGEGTAVVGATVRDVPGQAELTVDPAIDALEFAAQPTDAEAGTAIAPAVRVEVLDEFGDPVEDASATVMLSLGGGPSGATLLGTTAAAAADGVATFDDLRIEEAAAGYALEASTGGSLDPVTSETFEVSPGPVDGVEFTTQPADATAGEAIEPAVEVSLVDAFGNAATDAPGPVTVEVSEHPSGGTLAGGPTSVTPVDGVAAFPGLVLETAAEGFRLDVSAGAATGRSDPFSVLPGPAAEVAFLTHPPDIEGQQIFDPTVQVEVLDEFGNRATASSSRVTVNIDVATDPTGGRAWLLREGERISTISVGTLDDGVATFEELSVDLPAQGYRLEAGVTGLPIVESDPFDVFLTYVSLSTGEDHTCGVTLGDHVYCWGNNVDGQLGDGTTTDRPGPVAVLGGLALAAVTTGDLHSCGLTPGGEAHCWGGNSAGQLGDGSSDDREEPVAVVGGHTFTAIDAGLTHTCGVTTIGDAHCWGDNSFGQLGDGTTTERSSPTAVDTDVDFVAISAGDFHTCAVTAAGDAHCWGINSGGRLGDGTTDERHSPVPVVGGHAFAAVSAGGHHTCGRTDAGDVHCWGVNDDGRLGDGTTTDRFAPVPVAGDLSLESISAGSAHTCGAYGDEAYCWGDNENGRLGDGTTAGRTTPVAVSGPTPFAQVGAGGDHTCGVTPTGGVGLCWGANADGQLGIGTASGDRLTPVIVVQ